MVSKFKWLDYVSIQHEFIEPLSHFCGGALIHPMFVLTDGHCTRHNKRSRLVFGLIDLNSRSLNYSSVQVRYAYRTGRPLQLVSEQRGQLCKVLDTRCARLSEELEALDSAIIELNAPVEMSADVWPACSP